MPFATDLDHLATRWKKMYIELRELVTASPIQSTFLQSFQFANFVTKAFALAVKLSCRSQVFLEWSFACKPHAHMHMACACTCTCNNVTLSLLIERIGRLHTVLIHSGSCSAIHLISGLLLHLRHVAFVTHPTLSSKMKKCYSKFL